MASSLSTWLFQRARWVGYRSYYRLVAANYDHRWLSTEKQTPAGQFRSYDLLNRHGGDEMLAELHDHCDAEAVIYDIGANVGVYSLALGANSPARRLLAFEPAPRIRAQLQANVDCNALGDQIEVLDCGIGDEDGTRPFYLSTYPELSGFDRESASRWEASLAETIQAPVRRIDTIAERHAAPDAIKIDAEGASPAVLRGAIETLQRHQPTLCIEIHEEGLSSETGREAREVLESVEYSIQERADYWRCDPPASAISD